MLPEFVEMLSALSAAGAQFLVVGGYAVGVHIEPRATKDIDLWISPSPANARRVLHALDAFGAPRLGLTARDLESPDVVFQIGVPPRRIDLLTSLSGVTFDDAWASRVEAKLPGVRFPIPVIGRAALIQNKRAVGRPQDRVDVRNLERAGKASRKLPRRRG